MNHFNILKKPAFLAMIAAASMILSACTQTSTPTPEPDPKPEPEPMMMVETMMKDVIGDYLVDGDGMTLYYFTNDEERMSNADSAILATWPVFYSDDLDIASNLDASDFGTITRSDGKKQTTFRGWPLYYYRGDNAAGDINGQGFNDIWFVVSPDTFAPPKFFPLVHGWYKGMDVVYYDFGANTPLTGNDMVHVDDIFAFITGMDADGNPIFVEGQHNVIDTIPGDEGYSDLWHVHLVTVPENYVAESIKSEPDLMAAGYPITETDLLVNCPIVPAGSTTETGRPLVQGWYYGQKVYYFDYGLNPDFSAPIYALITGMDADGNPMFVEGQKNIIDVIPGDEGYSAFWDVQLVTVPENYVANTFKSAADVMASGYPITDPEILVNCPVIEE